ncbi:MAG: phosphate ABC transporter substrate-binding protein PstS [Nevskia sp.]|nr:phosphate ABC transporter substrate-binding protein PstS [Nevskia sp.]
MYVKAPKTIWRSLVAGAALSVPAAFAADISGAGATFPYPIYSKWAAAYKDKSGIGLNYQSIGSGGGIKQIKAKTVTFGASDKPLEAKELDEAGLTQFPAIVGGVVPVINLKGIHPGDLVLDGPTVADIFLGKVKAWNDPEIKKLNPKLALPSTLVAVVHRSDGSGTSFLFTSYLSQNSPEWKDKVGAATAVDWPTGVGAKGNEGVAAIASQTDGAIGYVEYAYAKQNKMTFTSMVNKDGKILAPSIEAFQAAAANADWAHAPAFYLVLTNQPGAASWPITGASFILVYKKSDDAAAELEALKFYDWAFKNGQKLASDLDYVPLPASVVDLIEASWKANIADASGSPLWK